MSPWPLRLFSHPSAKSVKWATFFRPFCNSPIHPKHGVVDASLVVMGRSCVPTPCGLLCTNQMARHNAVSWLCNMEEKAVL